MKLAVYTSIIVVAPLIALAQTAVGDRVLLGQFDQVASGLAPVFEKATAGQVPDTSVLPEITEIHQRLVTFEQKLQAVRRERLAPGGDAPWTKTLSLLQQSSTMLDFTLDSLGEWVSTRDPEFLMLAKQGKETLALIRNAIMPPPPGGLRPVTSTPTPPLGLRPLNAGAPASNGASRSAGGAGALAETPLSIQDAESTGLVRTSYRDPAGDSSGDSVVLLVVKIGGPARLVLSIPPGLVLTSPWPSSQSMVISGLKGRDVGGGKYTPAGSVVLTDDKPVRYVIEAYCAEFHKDNPRADSSDFGIPTTADPTLACILSEARKDKLSIPGTQAAVWIYTDHVSFPEMNTRMEIRTEQWSRAEAVASRCTSK